MSWGVGTEGQRGGQSLCVHRRVRRSMFAGVACACLCLLSTRVQGGTSVCTSPRVRVRSVWTPVRPGVVSWQGREGRNWLAEV